MALQLGTCRVTPAYSRFVRCCEDMSNEYVDVYTKGANGNDACTRVLSFDLI
jgi:hypothetical protein